MTTRDFDSEFEAAWVEYEKILVPFQACLRHIASSSHISRYDMSDPNYRKYMENTTYLIHLWSACTNKEWYRLNDRWLKLKEKP